MAVKQAKKPKNIIASDVAGNINISSRYTVTGPAILTGSVCRISRILDFS